MSTVLVVVGLDLLDLLQNAVSIHRAATEGAVWKHSACNLPRLREVLREWQHGKLATLVII